MTYQNSTAMNEHLNTLKEEGGQRSQRIGKILRHALIDAFAEVKEGAQTMSPVAKELTAEVVDQLKTQGHETVGKLDDALAQDLAQKTSPDPSVVTQVKTLLRKVLQLIREKLSPSYPVPAQQIEAGTAD